MGRRSRENFPARPGNGEAGIEGSRLILAAALSVARGGGGFWRRPEEKRESLIPPEIRSVRSRAGCKVHRSPSNAGERELISAEAD